MHTYFFRDNLQEIELGLLSYWSIVGQRRVREHNEVSCVQHRLMMKFVFFVVSANPISIRMLWRSSLYYPFLRTRVVLNFPRKLLARIQTAHLWHTGLTSTLPIRVTLCLEIVHYDECVLAVLNADSGDRPGTCFWSARVFKLEFHLSAHPSRVTDNYTQKLFRYSLLLLSLLFLLLLAYIFAVYEHDIPRKCTVSFDSSSQVWIV